jgi:CRP-like cAMP-binding protein
MLSSIERVIFLKEVTFFKDMTVDQLRALASVADEDLFPDDTAIYEEGDAGGVLYVVVSGRVGIEREDDKGMTARLATLEPRAYFGEMNLFDNSQRTEKAVALRDTVTLSLHRESLIALIRQYPDLSLALIKVISQRLRDASEQVAKLSRTSSRKMSDVFDMLEKKDS